MNFKASIVVISYNNVELTRRCLESIYAKTGAPKFQVVAVDNASQDSTPDFLIQFASTHPSMQVILNETNTGFARASNQGAQRATGEYLVFLNNDTVVTKGWLAGLMRHLQDPRVGMVGPVTNSSGNESRIPVNYLDITGLDKFVRGYARRHHGRSFEIPMLAFFCVMIPRAVFDQVGPLDERFGIGMFEDDDYALRLKEKGYKILCAEDVFVHHWGNASFLLIGQEYYSAFLENLHKFESKWVRRWYPQLSRREFLPQQLRDLAYQNARLELELSENERSLIELRAQAVERDRQVVSLQARIAEWEKATVRLNADGMARAQQIAALQANLAEGDQAIAVMRAEARERVDQIAALQAQILERDQATAVLKSQLVERDQIAATMQAQGQKLTQTIDDVRAQNRALRKQFARLDQMARESKWQTSLGKQLANENELENQLAEKEKALTILNKQLVDVHFSTGWALLQVLWRIRLLIIPHESLREKWARSVFRFIRSARQSYSAGGAQTDGLAPSLAEAANLPMAVALQKQNRTQNTITDMAELTESIGHSPGLVSVILPVYNQASFLSSSIQSVLAQTYQDFELIVIDDGSADDVDSVLAVFGEHPKVRILRQKNQTLPKALSNGFEFARGEFWTWTSADNLMHPDQLRLQVSFLQAHPDAAMVYADYLAIDDRGTPLVDPSFRSQNRRSPNSPEIHLPHSTELLNIVQDNFIGPCFMYRGWVGQLIGDYAPEFGCEDYDYWMRINLLFKIMHLGTDQILYQYRVHENTLNANAKALKIPERVQALMTFETDRYAFYHSAWTIYADPWTRGWLRQIKTEQEFLIASLDSAISGDSSSKILYLVHANSIPELAGRSLPPNSCVAAWFDADEKAPYVYQAELTRCVDICFACDQKTLARLSLSHPRAFQSEPGAGLLDLALAYGNNALAYRRRYEEADRCRDLPTVFIPTHHPLAILLQVDNFTQGGLEQAVVNLAACLQAQCFQVFLLVLGKRGVSVSKAEEIGVTVLTLPDDRRIELYEKLLIEKQIDLVNAHYSLFGAQVAASLNIPYVQTVHNSYVWFSPEERNSIIECDPFTTAYVCVSHNVAFYSDVRLHLSPTKMVIIPNGIDLEQFDAASPAIERQRLREELGLEPDDFVFLNVASIHPPKAQRFAVQALSRVRMSHANVKLVLVGNVLDDAYMDLIKADVEDGGLTQDVIFAGYRGAVTPFYWMADAFLLPSFWEGWSLALAEALYARLPIVASDVGAAQELLKQSAHRIIQPPYGDITDLDSSNMTSLFEQDHVTFVQDLANAMESICMNPSNPIPPNAFQRLDYQHAYAGYVHLFHWLIQGGEPLGARAWTRRLERTI